MWPRALTALRATVPQRRCTAGWSRATCLAKDSENGSHGMQQLVTAPELRSPVEQARHVSPSTRPGVADAGIIFSADRIVSVTGADTAAIIAPARPGVNGDERG